MIENRLPIAAEKNCQHSYTVLKSNSCRGEENRGGREGGKEGGRKEEMEGGRKECY